MIKTLFICIVFLVNLTALAQTTSVDGYLLLNGERFKNEKVVFTKAEGDWFVTPRDSHGAISFTGMYDGRLLHLDIEWDGISDAHLVTNDIRHDPKRLGEFILTMEDKKVYGDGLNAYPSGEDEVHIRITHITDLEVAGEWTGTVEQSSQKVKITGVFNVTRKAASKKLVNSSYKDCDNVIHDKLVGAEGRSPSECEARYDLDVRTVISEAVAPVVDKFQNESWQVQGQTNLDPLFVVGRGSEKDIFSVEYNLRLQASGASPVYATYKQQMDDFTEKMKQVAESGKPDKSVSDGFARFAHRMYGAVNVEVGVLVNNNMFSTGNYKGGAKITKLPDGIIKIESPYTQARTGGGEENSIDATFLLIGNWKQPVIKKEDDGSEDIIASPVLNPAASHLQTQNIIIRIEADASTADEVIKNLDLQKLRSLINR